MGLSKKVTFIFTFIVAFFSCALISVPAHAATLFLSPSSGTFTVGSTFDVSIFLNTKGVSANTVNAVLSFPADKLQLVSPTIGQSVISVWTAQPIFNNQTGTVKLTGGIPGGINVESGLITALTFRVKQVGSTTLLKFTDESRVLANDGSGTDILDKVQNGVYNLILPPPQGPIVSSETHPDQAKWYANKNVILRWAATSSVEKYSYTLDKDPASIPDNISEGDATSITYKNLDDGTHYFHIKALRDGVWGGTTSFGINVDTQPPAEFSLQISPSNRTSSKNQIINFETSDVHSQIAYYEAKIIPLTPQPERANNENDFFIEVTSPYQTALGLGTYDIMVRAYDKAGNYREVTSQLKVVIPLFKIISSQGIEVGGIFTIPWLWFWIIALILVIILIVIAQRVKKWHDHLSLQRESKQLPAHVKDQLKTLNEYRKKYGSLSVLFIVAGLLFFGNVSYAAQTEQTPLSPPFVSSVSRNISNEEIFYVGGKTENSGVTVVIYLQNLQTGETFNESVVSNAKGDWFYRHPTFLNSGDYILWTQASLGNEQSPPSPQIKMSVQKTAIQFGASRLSLESMYLIIVIIFLLIILSLAFFIAYHAWRGRKKHRLFIKEVMEAQESVRRGFAVLRRDIGAELALVNKTKSTSVISQEIHQKEEELLKDLDSIQKYISKEIWDVEQLS